MGGAMDGCGRCMKFSLVFINIITFIGGLCVVGVAGWVWWSRAFPSALLSTNMFVASVAAVTAIGALLVPLALLGCAGAAKEVKCMLLTYYIVMFILLVAMVAGGALLLVFRERALSSLARQLHAALPAYGRRADVTRAWDDTHTYLQCCGVSSYEDWRGAHPASCCKEVYPGQRLDCQESPNPSTMWTAGCLDKVVGLLREDAVYIGVGAIILAFIMLLALVFSCGLFVKIE